MFLLASAAVTICASALSAYIAARLTTRKFAQLSEAASKRRTAIGQAVLHELHTPCNSILGIVANLKRDIQSFAPKGQRAILELSEAGTALHRGLLDILDIFQLSARQLEITSQIVNLSDLLKTQISTLHAELASGFPDVDLVCGTETELWVETDPVRVRQCLTTLLRQCAFQAKKGKISIDLDTRPLSAGRMFLTFKIADESAGLDQSIANNYFVPEAYEENPFLRGRPADMLAMQVAKALAELLGGSIEAQSAPGSGVVFLLRIKATLASAQPARQQKRIDPGDTGDCENALQTARNEDSSADLIRGARILLVDDNETNLMVLEVFLNHLNVRNVACATSGFEALEILKQQTFDLIFMDIQMPELDGIETTRLIRRMGEHCTDVPIIAVSASSRTLNEKASKAAGMDGYVEKPLKEEELVAAIRNVVSRTQPPPLPKAA